MGENTRSKTTHRDTDDNVPVWAAPIVMVCRAIYLFLIIPALILIVVAFGLIVFGKSSATNLSGVINMINMLTTLGFLAWCIGRYDSFAPGWTGVVLAIAFNYGGPYAVGQLQNLSKLIPQLPGNVPAAAANIAHTAAARTDVAAGFAGQLLFALQNLAFFLICISIVRLLIGFCIKIINSQIASAERHRSRIDTSNKETLKPSLIPKCWQMSRCRPNVRMTCPNYIDRINCWKRRSGCFCDRELANYLVNSVAGGEAQEIMDMQVAAGGTQAGGAATVQGQLAKIRGHMKGVEKRSWSLQKKWCHECPLFLEHQEYKYKNLHWLSWVATLAIVGIVYSFFDQAYTAMTQWLTNEMTALVTQHVLPENFKPNESMNSDFKYVLLGVLTLLLLGYVIGFTETLFLKWKV